MPAVPVTLSGTINVPAGAKNTTGARGPIGPAGIDGQTVVGPAGAMGATGPAGASASADLTSPDGGVWSLGVSNAGVLSAVVKVPAVIVPTPTPVGIVVPNTIPSDGNTGVSAALNAWIAAQPNGSTLVFEPGKVYQLNGDAGLNLKGRSGLTLHGVGATLLQRTTGASNFSSAFFLENSTNITVRGFSVDGGSTTTGQSMPAVRETMNAIAIRAGCSGIDVDDVKWDNLLGFGPWISSAGGTVWPQDIRIRDCTIRGAEMGIAITAGRRVTIEDCTFRDTQYTVFDLEPDASNSNGGGFEDVVIRRNIVDAYGWHETNSNWFLATVPQDAVVTTCTMDRLTVEGNEVIRGAALPNNGNFDGLGGLGVRADKTNVKRGYIIRDNRTTHPDTRQNSTPRAVMNLTAVDGLTISGNVQPITGNARLVDAGTSTNVTLA